MGASITSAIPTIRPAPAPLWTPGPSRAVRQVWPQRQPFRGHHGLRCYQHESHFDHLAGTRCHQQKEPRTGLRLYGQDGRVLHSVGFELLHDVGERYDSLVLGGANRWPEWPQHIRVTVGAYEEMGKFNTAMGQVLKEGPQAQSKA
jgi:hypothetical protein